MGSSSGTHSSSERKRRRMESNRESARRSRMRKQQHLSDLTAHVVLLRRTNDQIVMSVRTAKRHAAAVEAENLALKAQMVELSHRLHSLREILNCINSGAGAENPLLGNNYTHPIMASVHMFNY